MTPLRQKMLEDMRLRDLAAKTQEAYVAAVRALAARYHRSPYLLTQDDLRAYFLYLVDERKLSRSTVRQHLCGIEFLFGQAGSHLRIGHNGSKSPVRRSDPKSRNQYHPAGAGHTLLRMAVPAGCPVVHSRGRDDSSGEAPCYRRGPGISEAVSAGRGPQPAREKAKMKGEQLKPAVGLTQILLRPPRRSWPLAGIIQGLYVTCVEHHRSTELWLQRL